MKPFKYYFMKIEKLSNEDLMKSIGKEPITDEVKELLRRYSSALATIAQPLAYKAQRDWDEEEGIWIITPIAD